MQKTRKEPTPLVLLFRRETRQSNRFVVKQTIIQPLIRRLRVKSGQLRLLTGRITLLRSSCRGSPEVAEAVKVIDRHNKLSTGAYSFLNFVAKTKRSSHLTLSTLVYVRLISYLNSSTRCKTTGNSETQGALAT